MVVLIRSLCLAALLALCWGLWQFIPALLQAAPFSIFAPIAALAGIMLLLTLAEWAHQKFRHGS